MQDRSSPSATRDQFAARVALAARQWRRAVDLRLKAFGLTEATWLPLLHLARTTAPIRQKDLAASLFLDSTSVVRILHGLQEAGLIDRREGGDDRRSKTILLTEAGRDLVARVEGVSQEVREEILGAIPENDLAAASEVLGQVCQFLSALNDRSDEPA
ncbi:MarR family transcriptional regulator, transcriptional regulator for hemolysin [Faunimonas pinastri]|uniref:MarR family transcriptional regulator, transcriptional regulator for hemolysin n=1 Tax=Faunimonas pinastri TaxID=1855383 RepID=A0A1H9K9I1_9HYPH|nr:MarR family transcriptional regulator [Faunimonas pinastri]SEQ95784.1 MarR family transcriptional regulator, transcriptional regulator for hemolysin [Faunimonas pinastri]